MRKIKIFEETVAGADSVYDTNKIEDKMDEVDKTDKIELDAKQFEQATHLRLRRKFPSSSEFYEISGKSYSAIQKKVKEYNVKFGTHVTCYDDTIKDVTVVCF